MHTPRSVVLTTEDERNRSWPLTVPLMGLPIWWVLGVWQLVFLAMAIPMAVQLLRTRAVRAPRGFGLWLLWMAWLVTGVLVLQVDAPFSVPGTNMNRYVSFAFRYAWYLAATIVCLYVVNTRHVLSSQKIMRSVSWLFVWFAAGGLLGLVAPGISVPSVLQAVLPDSVASNAFVNSLTRIQVAQVQNVLGEPLPRPSAPFFYTNEWGFATAISLPFFVSAWWGRGRTWRIGMVLILAAGLFAIISSLNRGVWIAILAAVSLAVVQTALQGRFKAITVSTVLTVSTVVLVLFSPLSAVVTGRLDNGVSDEVRGNLAITAVESAAMASPVVGFGGTRDVAGTFASIAGGASDLCPRCETPPLGTHGQLWLVTFGSGFVGVLLYVGFILGQFLLTLKARSSTAMAASASLLMLLVTLPFYDSVGIPIYLGLLGLGLLARQSPPPLPMLEGLVAPTSRNFPVLGMVVLLGGLAGQGVNMVLREPVTATQRVLVPAAVLVPVPGVRTSTLDSEAQLVRSEGVMAAVAGELGVTDEVVSEGLTVGAEANTRVLLVSYEADTIDAARLGAETAVATFLQERASLLKASREAVHERYAERQSALQTLHGSLSTSVVDLPAARLDALLTDIESQWNTVSGVLSGTDEPAPARTISGVFMGGSGGRGTVRVAGGLALGLLLGIPLTRFYDRRLMLLGARGLRHAGGKLGVVAEVPGSGLREAMAAVGSYLPVAGVLGDHRSGASMAMAAEIDRQLPPGSHAGRRTLMIVHRRSRAGEVKHLTQQTLHTGMTPVGLVLRGSSPESILRRILGRLRDERD